MSQRRINGETVYIAEEMKRFRDTWATPNGVEIFVVRAGRDRPEQVASMVEWLRQCYPHFGGWSVKPAPVFFERVLKEYLADYEYSEAEDDEDEETD